jgi:hypothetical protein
MQATISQPTNPGSALEEADTMRTQLRGQLILSFEREIDARIATLLAELDRNMPLIRQATGGGDPTFKQQAMDYLDSHHWRVTRLRDLKQLNRQLGPIDRKQLDQ